MNKQNNLKTIENNNIKDIRGYPPIKNHEDYFKNNDNYFLLNDDELKQKLNEYVKQYGSDDKQNQITDMIKLINNKQQERSNELLKALRQNNNIKKETLYENIKLPKEEGFIYNDDTNLNIYNIDNNFSNTNLKNNDKIEKLPNLIHEDDFKYKELEDKIVNKILNLINNKNYENNNIKDIRGYPPIKKEKENNIDFTNININQDENELKYEDDELNKYEIINTPIKNEKKYTNELKINYIIKILQSMNHSIHKYLKINILDINKNEIFIELEFDTFTYIKQDYIYNKIINYVYSYNNKNNISPILKDIKFNIVSVINGYFM